VISQRLTAANAYFGTVQDALNVIGDTQISPLDGLSEEDVIRCLGRSSIIECSAGDRVLKKGGVARNMFVVLDGTLEVKDGDTLVRALGPGNIVGEMAFLLEMPRTMDVYAATDDVRVLSLSESTLRKMIADEPEFAAKLMFNISKMLCMRMMKPA
jgi:CRP-like cAMP-binding protein